MSGNGFGGAEVTESTFINRTPSRSHSGEIFAAIAVSDIKVPAPESVSAYSHSEIVADRQMGTLIPPEREMAHCAAANSNPGDTRARACLVQIVFNTKQRRCEGRGAVEQILVGVHGGRGAESDRA